METFVTLMIVMISIMVTALFLSLGVHFVSTDRVKRGAAIIVLTFLAEFTFFAAHVSGLINF